jgi:hypothetical protein
MYDPDLFPIDVVEDAGIEDWEADQRSDSELIGDLAAIRALNQYEPSPHLDYDELVLRGKIEHKGLLWDSDREDEEFDNE